MYPYRTNFFGTRTFFIRTVPKIFCRVNGALYANQIAKIHAKIEWHYLVSQQTELTQSEPPPTSIKGTWIIKPFMKGFILTLVRITSKSRSYSIRFSVTSKSESVPKGVLYLYNHSCLGQPEQNNLFTNDWRYFSWHLPEPSEGDYHLHGKTRNHGWKQSRMACAIPFGSLQKIWAVH